MKFLILTLATFAVVAAADEKVVPHMLGGTDTQWGQFASSVIIDGPNEFCGGTVIDGRHVSAT